MQEYLPLAILAIVLISIRLDRASIQNSITVTIGALSVWALNPFSSPLSTSIFFFLAVLSFFMSPLLPTLKRAARNPGLGHDELRRHAQNSDPINILHDPADAELDIVAVHGLGSSIKTTWVHKESGKFWLRDFLPDDFPRARIMTFRHNSGWMSTAVAKDLSEHGKQLLDYLEGRRADIKPGTRPLILVGHSFGGLVIEQALNLAKEPAADDSTKKRHADIANSVAGVIFLGTPHSGSSYSFLGKVYCLLNYWDGANPLLLTYMEPSSEQTMKVEDDFMKHYPKGISFDFYEKKKNVILGVQFDMVVNRGSGTRRGQEASHLETDHFGLNKYESKSDMSYIAVKNKMKQMLRSWTDEETKKIEKLTEHEAQTLKDLDPCDFSITSASRHRHLTRGTCEWVTEENEWKTWDQGDKNDNILWILGNLGSGKTYLAQWVCDHLKENKESNVMYFFFDAKNEDSKDLRSLQKFYQTILHQLLDNLRKNMSRHKTECFEKVRKILREGVHKAPHLEALSVVLRKSRLNFLVIDALDECREVEVAALQEWLAEIGGLPNLRIVITSRSMQSFLAMSEPYQETLLQLVKVEDKLNQDIEKYIKGRIERPGSVFPREMSAVVAELKARSSGMILYARLMLEILEEKCGTEEELLHEMKMLPKTLTRLYANRLNSIKDKRFASKMLQWLVISRRPLTLDGLRSVDTVDRTLERRESLDLARPEDLCSVGVDRSGRDMIEYHLRKDLLPLVEILDDRTVRLVHTTISEFLLGREVEDDGVGCPKDFRVILDTGHQRLALTCVTYLRWGTKNPSTPLLNNQDLRDYAVLEWPEHCEKSQHKIVDVEREKSAFMGFFQDETVFDSWLTSRTALDSLFRSYFGLHDDVTTKPRSPLPLHVAVFFNIWQFGRLLLALSTSNIDIPDATGSTALHIAAGQGYSDIVRELLLLNATMDLVDASGLQPIHRAVRRGNHGALEELLGVEKGKELVNVIDKYKFTPMHVACQLGWDKCVDVLLKHHAQLRNETGAIASPIGLAIQNGHIEIVHKLLKEDQGLVDLCVKSLLQAARRGLVEMVKSLCQSGVDTSYQDGLKQTVLHKACIAGNDSLVEYLLDKCRLPVNAKDNSQRTPLYFAAERGHLEIVECLLRNNAEKNTLDRREETVLFKPAGNGHTSIVDCLLTAGTDATILDTWKRTPLRFASMKGRKEIVTMLLERTKIDQDRPDWVGRTALHNAAAYLREGQESTIDVLFDHGANPCSLDYDGHTALHAAILREESHPNPTNSLLDKLVHYKVPIETRDNQGRTALCLAIFKENITAVKLLLYAGATTSIQEVIAAVELGNLELTQVLLEPRPKLEWTQCNYHGDTALHIAASQGRRDIIVALLNAGAPKACLNMNQETPLDVALSKSATGIEEGIEDLLQEADSTPEDYRSAITSPEGLPIDIPDSLNRTWLHKAVIRGDLNGVRELLGKHTRTDIADQIGWTPVHYATQTKDPAILTALIKANASVHDADKWKRVPLHLAASVGNVAGVEVLLAAQANFELDYLNQSPLHVAVLNGSYQTVNMLVGTDKGKESIQVKDWRGRTAIHLAAELGDPSIMEKLLEYTQSLSVINAKDDSEQTPLFLASEKGRFEVVKKLIQAGSLAYPTNNEHAMALHLAANKGHLQIVTTLLDTVATQAKTAIKNWIPTAPSQLTERDSRELWLGVALLVALRRAGALVPEGEDWRIDKSMWATPEQQEELLDGIVSALWTYHDSNHSIPSTTLMQAVRGGHADMVRLLLEKIPQMPLQTRDYWGLDPLSQAAKMGNVEIAKLLINKGSKVNAITDSQRTCLHEAAEEGHAAMIKLLLEHEANPDVAQLSDGFTPLHVAAMRGHVESVQALVLVTYVDVINDLGRTPLHVACLDGRDDAVIALVNADANLTVTDSEGKTPLSMMERLREETQVHMETKVRNQAQGRRGRYS